MLYCPGCGKEIERICIYCPACGTKVEGISCDEENEASLPKISQSLELKVAKLRERIAEARHNEQIGWGSVGIAVILVIALAIIHMQAAARNALFTSPSFSPVDYTFVNISIGLTILAAILVVLGVALSIYSRHQRTRLLKELENIED